MKILAIASIGGHWVQLLRLRPAFEGMEVVFLSNKESFANTVPENKFYAITDANRKTKTKLIISFFQIFKIVFYEKPDVIITTGAAPGLMGIAAGKVLGVRTVWIDSIANVEELSLSGRIASKIADRVYTQWPDLETSKILYAGSVLL